MSLKILLANKTTAMLHGDEEAKKSEETAKQTFREGVLGDNLPTIQIMKKEIRNQLKYHRSNSYV